MIAPAPGDERRLQRMEEASVWLQRLRSARHDDPVVEEWLDWCQRDPRNQQCFDEMAAVWELSGRLVADSSSRTNAPARHTRRYALAASIAGLGLALGGAWWLARSPVSDTVIHEYASPVGQNAVHHLADGSVLELGGGTQVTVSIGALRRVVELHAGELFVTVHPDASRPFSVDAGRLAVVATGTAFNVLRTDLQITVTVAEGSVDALYEGGAAAAPNVRLESSQQLVYSHASHRVVVRQAIPGNAIAWRNGTLHFEDEPLSEVIAIVNRYASRAIVIDDPLVDALSFTGTARTDRIEGWLQALPHVFPVAIVELGDGRRLIRPRPDVRNH